MRLLMISHLVPFPADNGAKQRTLHLVRQLAQGADVLLLCPPMAASRLVEFQALLGPAVTVVCAALEPVDRQQHPAGFFSPLPRGVLRSHRLVPMTQTLAEAIDHWHPEVLLATDPIVGEFLRPYHGMRRVVDIAQEYGLYIKRVMALSPLLERWRWRLRLLKWQGYTRQLASHVDLWLVPGVVDRAELAAQLPAGARIAVIPNGMDVIRNAYAPQFDGPPVLVHSGALSYEPNRDGLLMFVAQIWPLIRLQLPTAELQITGAAEDAPPLLRHTPGIRLLGYVPDIRPVVREARAAVVPLRLGVGTRLKIMEAMALGTPVVSTSVGAEGLAVHDGVHLLLADQPERFAAQVVRLLADRPLRERLSHEARHLIERRYSWDVIGADLRGAITHLALPLSSSPLPLRAGRDGGRG